LTKKAIATKMHFLDVVLFFS